jgi:hypothetical protein
MTEVLVGSDQTSGAVTGSGPEDLAMRNPSVLDSNVGA